MELAYKRHLGQIVVITLKRIWLDELKGDHLHPFCLNMLSNSKPIKGGQVQTDNSLPLSYEIGIGCS